MKQFRCYNCQDVEGTPGHDFFADKPVCDKCGLDGTIPKYARLFAPLKVIHFNPPDPAVERGAKMLVIGMDYAACNPDLVAGKARLTNVATATNCPACKETEVWQKANKQATVLDDEDFTITGDMDKLVFSKNG